MHKYINTHIYQIPRWSHIIDKILRRRYFIFFVMQSEIELKEIHETFL